MLENISPPLDRDQLIMQAAALADHLHRAGVQWMPRPNEQAVQELKTRLFSPNAEAEGAGNAAASTMEAPGAGTQTPVSRPDSASLSAANPSAAKPTPAKTVPTKSAPATTSAPTAAGASPLLNAVAKPYPGASLPLAQRESELVALASEVAACQKCSQLARCRTHTVFGEGNANARVVFFGEAPGADEDREARPFVGKAGELLTKMIQACKFSRDDVYILNTVKCRPPGNRNPDPEEIANCRPYFEKQIELIRPEYIVCLGAVSGQALLDSKLSVGRLRGRFHPYFDSKVVVTYHPAYLLRNPAAKKAAWDDLQMMLRDAGLL
ncbi:Uracil DNA glycosylase superfamily protein [Novipirellula galeiformis]|uniref:Type-4 uracil-DNA glycosylase n=1 Tax=Novipirellula galeiformis TaxID=2528004 RepID=A0A5C6C6J8_9BACT|nr:uracil-DNA glycosylase [Novipirellula galeiformis]TWU20253.1 Uracil DNA glycosylase superfamily protein [Novipirellula galeiformis]